MSKKSREEKRGLRGQAAPVIIVDELSMVPDPVEGMEVIIAELPIDDVPESQPSVTPPEFIDPNPTTIETLPDPISDPLMLGKVEVIDEESHFTPASKRMLDEFVGSLPPGSFIQASSDASPVVLTDADAQADLDGTPRPDNPTLSPGAIADGNIPMSAPVREAYELAAHAAQMNGNLLDQRRIMDSIADDILLTSEVRDMSIKHLTAIGRGEMADLIR